MIRQSVWGLAGIFIMAAVAMSSSAEAAKTPIDILVPAYFYPGVDGNGNGKDDWQDMVDATKDVGVTAIMNPASGSGDKINPDYVSAVSKLRKSGGIVIGYIATDLGRRPMVDLQREIQNYVGWYGVDGFFFDQMPTSFYMNGLSDSNRRNVYKFYEDLSRYIKNFKKSDYIIGNAGNLTEERFLDVGIDALVTLENDITKQSIIDPPAAGVAAYTPSPWQTKPPHDRTEFGLIQHNVVGVADMQAVVDAGIKKGFGLFYVTDDNIKDNNPFDRLPTYWDAFVAKIKNIPPFDLKKEHRNKRHQ